MTRAPEGDGPTGFTIEGAELSGDGTTLYVGFRGPLTADGKALVVPVPGATFVDQAGDQFERRSLRDQVTGTAEAHHNADEPTVLDYNTNVKSAGQIASLYAPDRFRTSDHDNT